MSRQLNRFFAFVVIFCGVTAAVSVQAAPIDFQERLFGGVVINEILSDPSAGDDACSGNTDNLHGFDTNEDGCVNQADEFIELYNGLDEPIEIGGWSVWTKGGDFIYTFPAGAEIAEFGYVILTADWESGRTGETADLDGAQLFSADQPEGILPNSGDNIVLLDPDFEEFIQVYYTGAGAGQTETIDDPLDGSYPNFPEFARLLGSPNNFGLVESGTSQVRRFSGDSNIVKHSEIDEVRASPGGHYTAVTLTQSDSEPTVGPQAFVVGLTTLLLLLTAVYLWWQRPLAA